MKTIEISLVDPTKIPDRDTRVKVLSGLPRSSCPVSLDVERGTGVFEVVDSENILRITEEIHRLSGGLLTTSLLTTISGSGKK